MFNMNEFRTLISSSRAEMRRHAAYLAFVASESLQDEEKKDVAQILIAHLGDDWIVVSKCVEALTRILESGIGALAPFVLGGLPEVAVSDLKLRLGTLTSIESFVGGEDYSDKGGPYRRQVALTQVRAILEKS